MQHYYVIQEKYFLNILYFGNFIKLHKATDTSENFLFIQNSYLNENTISAGGLFAVLEDINITGSDTLLSTFPTCFS